MNSAPQVATIDTIHPNWDSYAGLFELLEAAGAGYVRVFSGHDAPSKANNYAPGKAPAGKGWKTPRPLEQVFKHYLCDGNVGLLCGHARLIVVDADAKSPGTTAAGIVAAWPALAGTLTIFRDTAPERAKFVIRIADGDPLPEAEKAGGLEILSISKEGIPGNQAVIAGTHAGDWKDPKDGGPWVQMGSPAPLLWRCDAGQILVATAAQVAALVATVTGVDEPAPVLVLPDPPAGFGMADLDSLYPPQAAHPTAGRPLAVRRQAYVDDIVTSELAAMRNTTLNRNDALNETAFTLGTLAAGIGEPTGAIESMLFDAAIACGLDKGEAEKTIRSGLEAGQKRPRALPVWWNDDDGDPAGMVTPAAGGQPSGTTAPAAAAAGNGGQSFRWPLPGDDSQGFFLGDGGALWRWFTRYIKGDPEDVAVPVADFHLRIVGVARDESGGETWELAGYGVRSGPLRAEIPAASYGDTAKIVSALEKISPLASIQPNQHGYFRQAMKILAEPGYPITRRYDRTGWAADGRFLIPGREPEGVTLALPAKLPYGCPPSAQLPDGLRGLAAVLQAPGDAGIGAALVAFVLQGPAARPMGLHNERYALFLVGRTGSLKTSTAQAAMCIYGDGWADDAKLLKWGEGATRNAIMAHATYAHDLPFILDNFKPNTGDGSGGAVSLIHNIVEGSDRERSDRTGGLRQSRPIAAWPLCTGEDIPQGDAAAIARILALPFSWQMGAENTQLTAAQGLATHLPAVGAAWLGWLEGEGGALAAEAGKPFTRERARWAAFLRGVRPDMPNILRVASNLASNRLAYLLACEHPEIGPVLQPYRKAHEEALQAIGRHMSRLTVESLEAERWLSHLRAAVASGAGVILDLNAAPADIARALAGRNVIGYSDNRGVYVVAESALTVMKGAADVTNHISANALNRQLVKIGAIASQGKDKISIVKKVFGGTKRVLHLRADILTEPEAVS